MRARLRIALVILAGFWLIAAVGLGVALHDRAETSDSLEHWRARLREEQARPPGSEIRLYVGASAASRIQRLEQHLESNGEALFARGAMLVFFSVMIVLGARALRLPKRD
ncbi:MAG: hypothetical protein QNJ98_16030 [Planctomycetota bacterium]|nr:hypothetical protein [Planctomycetota bacterium]